jgi:hypothetical protein
MPKTEAGYDLERYAPVARRITLFYERYPAGRIITELVTRDDRQVVFRALVYRSLDEPNPAATGWALEREGDGEVNAVACLENTETSAIGRALANLGFTASTERPSREEMVRARGIKGSLQLHADALSDVLVLLATARRVGMRATRVADASARLRERTPPEAELERLASRLRAWIARHEPRVGASV